MRIAKVIGKVTLNRCHPSFDCGTYKLAVPLSLEDLVNGREPAADPLVVYDQLGAGPGSLIAVSEGAEAAMPFRPNLKPVDAYNAAILDEIDIR